jgi:hypothetical protein
MAVRDCQKVAAAIKEEDGGACGNEAAAAEFVCCFARSGVQPSCSGIMCDGARSWQDRNLLFPQ